VIRIYSPTEAGRIIDRKLSRIEQGGLTGKAALARLVRPGNIAASFGSSGLVGIASVEAPRAVNLVEALGIDMFAISAGEFIYQGEKVSGKGVKLAETELTNGQFRKLLELKPEELAEIIINPQERLEESVRVAADPAEAENCPMVGLSQVKSEKIAGLLGLRLPTEQEWERAAAGTNGRKFSFGAEFDESRVTFDDKGTRSVYAHRDVATPEGVLDLSGNVWEWTSSNYSHDSGLKVLRGGSWNDAAPVYLQAANRDLIPPEFQCYSIGVRFAKDL